MPKKLKFTPKAKSTSLVGKMQRGVSSYLKGTANKGLDFEDTSAPKKKRKKS